MCFLCIFCDLKEKYRISGNINSEKKEMFKCKISIIIIILICRELEKKCLNVKSLLLLLLLLFDLPTIRVGRARSTKN